MVVDWLGAMGTSLRRDIETSWKARAFLYGNVHEAFLKII